MELRSLINHHDALCGTFILNAKATESLETQARELFASAAAEAKGLTDSRTYRAMFSTERLGQIEQDLRTQTSEFSTLMVFHTRSDTRYQWLDRTLQPRVVLDDTFFVQPLSQSLLDSDSINLVWLSEASLRHERVSWTGSRLVKEVGDPWRGGRTQLGQLSSLQRSLKRSRLPWILAGSIAQVQSDHASLFRSQLRKSLATVVQSNLNKARHSVRQISQLRNESIGASLAQTLSQRMGQPRPTDRIWTSWTAIHDSLTAEAAHTLVIDRNLVTGEGYTLGQALTRRSAPELLRIDDLVEIALQRSISIVEAPDLQEQIGAKVAAIRIEAKEDEWIN